MLPARTMQVWLVISKLTLDFIMDIINELIRLAPLIGGIWIVAKLYSDIYRDFDRRSDLIETRLASLEGQFLAFQRQITTSNKYIEQAIDRLESLKS